MLARALALLVIGVVPASAAAQLRSAVYGLDLPPEHDTGAVAIAIEAATAAAGLTPARDPLLDSAPADLMLLSYVGARSDAVALVVRVRPLGNELAVEAVAAREIVVRRHQTASSGALATTVRDVVRLALDALLELHRAGAERSPGPPRVAIVIDDPSLAAVLDAPLRASVSATALVTPPSVVSAARLFLPPSSDPAQNTVVLRERLDVDRIFLVVPSDTGARVHVIDASRTDSHDIDPHGDVTAFVAGLPAPTRRPALRVSVAASAVATSAAPTNAVVTGTGDGAPPTAVAAAPEEHAWLASTGRDYTWERVAHLAFLGAFLFNELGVPAGGFGLNWNIPIVPLVNQDGFALPLSIFPSLFFQFAGENGSFFGAVPIFSVALQVGFQIRRFFVGVHTGGGFVVTVAAGGGATNAFIGGVGHAGVRLGVPLLEHSAVDDDHDLFSGVVGLDVFFDDVGWSGIASVGVSL